MEVMGIIMKVYMKDMMEIKRFDSEIILVFNMVCNNGWERLVEMVVK